jgi:hypothetical protein
MLIKFYFEFSVLLRGPFLHDCIQVNGVNKSFSLARTVRSSSRASDIVDLRQFLTIFILLNVRSSLATATGAVSYHISWRTKNNNQPSALRKIKKLSTCVRLLNQSNQKLRKSTHQRKELRKKEKKT